MKLFLDDERTPWDGTWQCHRTFGSMKDAVTPFLHSVEEWEISLDNDLGETREGWEILYLIEEAYFLSGKKANLPQRVCIHTANIAARKRMQSACKSLGYFLARSEERVNNQCRGEVWIKGA